MRKLVRNSTDPFPTGTVLEPLKRMKDERSNERIWEYKHWIVLNSRDNSISSFSHPHQSSVCRIINGINASSLTPICCSVCVMNTIYWYVNVDTHITGTDSEVVDDSNLGNIALWCYDDTFTLCLGSTLSIPSLPLAYVFLREGNVITRVC